MKQAHLSFTNGPKSHAKSVLTTLQAPAQPSIGGRIIETGVRCAVVARFPKTFDFCVLPQIYAFLTLADVFSLRWTNGSGIKRANSSRRWNPAARASVALFGISALRCRLPQVHCEHQLCISLPIRAPDWRPLRNRASMAVRRPAAACTCAQDSMAVSQFAAIAAVDRHRPFALDRWTVRCRRRRSGQHLFFQSCSCHEPLQSTARSVNTGLLYLFCSHRDATGAASGSACGLAVRAVE